MKFLTRRGASVIALLFGFGFILEMTPPRLAAQGAGPSIPLDADRLAAAKNLMEVVGAAKQLDTMFPVIIKQMEGSFRQLRPDLSSEFDSVFRLIPERFAKRKYELIDQVALVYASALTTEELNETARFYQGPTGSKFIRMMPQMMQQSMAIGQAWGQKIGEEIDQDVRNEMKQRGKPI